MSRKNGPKDGDDFKKSFILTDTVLKFIGLTVFYTNESGLSDFVKNRLFFVASVIVLSTTVMAESIYMITLTGETFLERAALVTCIAFCCLGLAKMFVLYLNRKALQEQFEEIHKIWPTGEQPPEVIAIKTESLNRLYFTTTLFFWSYMVVMTLYNIDPLIDMMTDFISGETCYKAFPYLVYIPFNSMGSVTYQLVSLYLGWAGYISAMGIVAQDCMFQLSCSHISMLLEILGHDLLNLIPKDYSYSTFKNMDESTLIEKLISIIKRHQKLISMAEVLENTYNFVIMVNIVAASVIICLVGFQATIADTKQLIKFSFSTVGTTLQAFILSWYGNLLIDKSKSLADAAYNCSWYETGPKFRRSLRIFMIRTHKPIHVTAFKFRMISLNTFTSIVSSSWSYFTLLRTVYDPTTSS